MIHKLWIGLCACLLLLSAPLGGAAAQTAASAVPAPASGRAVNAAAKLSYRLQLLTAAPQLLHGTDQALSAALSVPAHGPGSLLQDDQNRLLVDVRLADTAPATLAALRGAGAQVVDVSPQYNVVTALVAVPDLSAAAQLGAVQNIQEEITPIHASQLNGQPPTLKTPAAPATSTCPVGISLSGGDAQLKADQARTTFHVDGSGVKVGILSDSFDRDASAHTHPAADIASGDLPGVGNTCGAGFTTPVHVISESVSASVIDEGRGMSQIVHDLAPKAQLGFNSAWNGLFSFANNIRTLRTWGAKVIADDVFYFNEPMFQEGPVSVAIGDVTSAGATYFASAGNNNFTLAGHQVSSYEAPAYRPMAVPAALAAYNLQSCHDFDPGPGTDVTDGFTLDAGGEAIIGLQWAEPWYGITTDFDLFVTDGANTFVGYSSRNTNTGALGTQQPFEYLDWFNSSGSVQSGNVLICRRTANGGDTLNPRIKFQLVNPYRIHSVEHNVSTGGDIVGPAIFGHSASLYSISVAAAPFNDDNHPEDFSSPGPATHYFGPVVGTSPAAAITPVVIHQPDFTASDGACTTFFGEFQTATCYEFFGTSAAAPHAAAVAALIKQTSIETPTVPITQGSVRSLLASTAAHMTGGTVNTVGAGLVDALAAITKLLTLVGHTLFLPLVRR